jgi:hypothetical protein
VLHSNVRDLNNIRQEVVPLHIEHVLATLLNGATVLYVCRTMALLSAANSDALPLLVVFLRWADHVCRHTDDGIRPILWPISALPPTRNSIKEDEINLKREGRLQGGK